MGHLAIQYAKAMGLQVLALDVGQDKLDFCKGLGADEAVNALDKDAQAKVGVGLGWGRGWGLGVRVT